MMLIFPTQNLFIEGPDCSGKTTLVKNLHEKTGYRWHIHDRSQISRKIFSDMHKREIQFIESDLHSELSNLNNRFIFMIPEFSVIRERFLKRGDELYSSLESMKEVYDIFVNSYDHYSGYPNVIPCLSVATMKQCDALISTMSFVERLSLEGISDQVERFVSFSGGESYPLQFTLYDDGKFEEADRESLEYHPEKEYYREIYEGLHEKIRNELGGKNEYGRRESYSSRRFIYTNNSCISLIHVSIRDEIMDFHVVIRSSDTKNTFSHDLKFLYYLSSTCYRIFGHRCNQARLRFNLNSAHIIS
tara:strand:- start:2696 stop:3604 length:909 start_codon:yes stop_codon:yes gene_type:complete